MSTAAEKTQTSAGAAAASATAGSSTAGATSTPQPTGGAPSASQSDPGAIRATAQMWRCSKIMHLLRDLHPTLLSALEGVVDQVRVYVPQQDSVPAAFEPFSFLTQTKATEQFNMFYRAVLTFDFLVKS